MTAVIPIFSKNWTMKILPRFLMAGILAVALMGCASKVQTAFKHDPQTNFSQYRTFAVKDFSRQGDEFIMNELNRRRLSAMVSAELEARGLSRDQNNPDLEVFLHSIFQTKEGVNDPMESVPYGRSLIWRQPQPQVYTYDQAMLVIDLVDADRNEAVWEGSGKLIIDMDRPITDVEGKLQKIVSKIMAGYPPKK